MGKLEGKVAIVTGGARGIGRGIALELAKEGADIVIADIDLENAREAATELQAMGREVTVVEVDVTSETSVRAGVEQALERHGRIDILVNNAGVVGQHLGAAASLADWDSCYEVNLRGTWIMSRALAPHFEANGGGKIVNITSIAGRKGAAAMPHYCASKAGAINLTQSLAQELGPSNINVNAVCPGLLWTEMWRHLEGMFRGDSSPEVIDRRQVFDQYIQANCPLRREQTPEDIGLAVAFLASEDARNITGQSLNVDGGIEMA